MHIIKELYKKCSLLSIGRLVAMFCILVLTAAPVHAQGFERLSDIESEAFAENAFVNGDYETMKNIRSYWQQEVQRLRSIRNLEFALTGGNEAVLKVTIPARLLFGQNDTLLISSAEGYLRPLLRLVRGDEAKANLIIASYSDNNGSENYLNRLSTGRAATLHRWFAKQSVGPANLHSFGFGNRVPRNGNASIKERERNRRVSLYFVPNKKMIKNAKKGTL